MAKMIQIRNVPAARPSFGELDARVQGRGRSRVTVASTVDAIRDIRDSS
ncbi:MAG: hypothetical protein ACSLFR_17920 [Solirubrobacteraceae bacterium]